MNSKIYTEPIVAEAASIPNAYFVLEDRSKICALERHIGIRQRQRPQARRRGVLRDGTLAINVIGRSPAQSRARRWTKWRSNGYHSPAATHSVAEARNHLPALIDRALDGEGVVITRHGQPVVGLRTVNRAL